MSRFIRNTAILVKRETTYGTDASPVGTTDAVLVKNVNINPLVAQNVDRALIRPYFGGSEQLVGTSYVELSYEVDLAGSGTAGTAPAWGAALRACGFAEAVTAGNRVEYTPISTSFDSATIYYHDDGLRHIMLGARGSVVIDAQLSQIPVLRFSMRGLVGTVSAQSNPTVTLTAWQRPLVVTDANTGDVTLGATYSAGTLSAGTSYPSRGITIDAGIDVNHIPLLGGESVDITGRITTGSASLFVTAAQEATLFSTVTGNTTQSVGFQHGSTSGNTVVVHAPAVQLINPTKQEFNGRRMIGYDMRFVPSSGNDELRIVAR